MIKYPEIDAGINSLLDTDLIYAAQLYDIDPQETKDVPLVDNKLQSEDITSAVKPVDILDGTEEAMLLYGMPQHSYEFDHYT